MNIFFFQCSKIIGLEEHLAIIKLDDEVLAWLSVWSEEQMICIWSSYSHCHKQLLNVCLSMLLAGVCMQIFQKVPQRKPSVATTSLKMQTLQTSIKPKQS